MSTYNGWTNYETWLVKLWIDNEQYSQDYWLERAKENDNVADLSRALKDEFEGAMPELEGFWHDLLSSAMSEVNWREIAENLLGEISEDDSK